MQTDSWPALAAAIIIAVLAVYALTSLGSSIERSAKELAKIAEIIYTLRFECHREGWHSINCHAAFRDEAGLGRVA